MKISLLPYQMRFLKSRHKFVWLKAGLGSGKTFALAHYIIIRMLKNPETLGLIAANSYTQLHKSILTELFYQLECLGLSYTYNILTKEVCLLDTGAKAMALSLEKYDQLRGIEFGWEAIDEGAYAREEAYNVAIGRLRCKRSHRLEIRIASTPDGFNFLYDRFASGGYISRIETPIFHRDKYHELISASARDNFHLPDGYLDSLATQYDPLLYEQEVEGEFINTDQGKVYHAFDRTTCLEEFRGEVINRHAGSDFNVNPLTSVLASVISNNSVHIYDEVWLEHSNTFELADKLTSIEYGMTVIPDATGSARKTSASKTDHQILRDAGLIVKSKRKNPSVKDRHNNTNRWLSNGWLKISPKCTHLIEDLSKLTHDNTDPKLSHISDALGYLLWHINPLRRPQPKSEIIE